jgi:N-acyl amino acid synthase of PEP-CTERM/exosortase system
MPTSPQPEEQHTSASPHPHGRPYFTARVVDGIPELLDGTYRLRYQVYCLERRFLPPEQYPTEREVDSYDSHSVHVAVVNAQGDIAATARLIELTDAGLPLLDHCVLFPHGGPLRNAGRRIVEVSRLSVSRLYNRRAGDAHYALASARYDLRGEERRTRGRGGEIIMILCQALYQASKRAGYTHWLAATERSLQRLIAAYSLPFEPIGPETDYYGKVTPYSMSIDKFDAIIVSGTVPLVSDFLAGLEPEFLPPKRARATGEGEAARRQE